MPPAKDPKERVKPSSSGRTTSGSPASAVDRTRKTPFTPGRGTDASLPLRPGASPAPSGSSTSQGRPSTSEIRDKKGEPANDGSKGVSKATAQSLTPKTKSRSGIASNPPEMEHPSRPAEKTLAQAKPQNGNGSNNCDRQTPRPTDQTTSPSPKYQHRLTNRLDRKDESPGALMNSASLSEHSTIVGSSSCDIWTNFCIDGNAKQTYAFPEGKEVTVQNLTDKLMIKDWQSWEKLLQNLRIKTTYIKDSRNADGSKLKPLKIRGFGRQPELNEHGIPRLKDKKPQFIDGAEAKPANAKELLFLRNGEMISVDQYFLTQHKVHLSETSWVLDCGRKKRPTWIPAEKAIVLPGQTLRPEIAEKLRGKWQLIPQLGSFGVTKVPGKQLTSGIVLTAPKIQYKDTEEQAKSATASWNMIAKQAVDAKALKWTILKLGDVGKLPDPSKIIEALARHGVSMQQPAFLKDIHSIISQGEAFDQGLQKEFGLFKYESIRLVLVILPSNKAATYARVKHWGDYKNGVHTVCVKSENLRNYSQAIASLPKSRADWNKDQKVALRFFAGLALKYNIKAGGVNHKVNSTMLQNPNDSGPIFVGINVTNLPSNSCSIASVAANSGSDLSKWPGSIRCQQGSGSLVQDLEMMMKERMSAFVGKKARPSKIIVYRGGVTEDQYQRVLDDEFPKIKRARDTVYSGEGGPKITMLIVSKGHQNRFHPVGNHIVGVDRRVNGESNDSKNAASGPMVNSSRPTPGTIIERKHDLDGAWDFFLQSHYAPDGIAGPSSAKPAHYIVIKEEEKHPAMDLQAMTNDLCYSSATSTRAMSICIPLYYANLISQRARWSLEEYVIPNPDPTDKTKYTVRISDWNGLHENLKNTMFYV